MRLAGSGMITDQPAIWESLLLHAFDIIDAAERDGGGTLSDWSLGGCPFRSS